MSTVTPSLATPRDRLRQVLVAVGGALAVVVAAWGGGAFGGTPMAEVADGAFAPDATVLAPASNAFAIWSVIYIGLIIFTVYQALPARAADPRLRAVAWWVLASMILNAGWIAVAHTGVLWGSVVIIVALVAVLVRIGMSLVATPAQSWRGVVTTDIPIGLYLGWVTVATAANIAATIADAQAEQASASPAWVAGAIIAVTIVTGFVVLIAWRSRSRPGVALPAGLAATWGLMWIAIARADGQPASLGLMWAAGLAACVTFAVPFAMRDFSRGDQGPPG